LAGSNPPLCYDCFEVCSGLDFIDIRSRALNDNGAIYINNSLLASCNVLNTQDSSSDLIRIIHAFFWRRRVEYLAARFLVQQDITLICIINALEVGDKRGWPYFVVLEGIVQEDDNSSISEDLALNHPIIGLCDVNIGNSCSILIVGVIERERRVDLPDGSVEEELC